jgi:peptide/nickel transport system permease protein
MNASSEETNTAVPARPGADDARSSALRRFLSQGLPLFGVLLWLAVLLVAVIGPHLYHVDPFQIVYAPRTPPGVTPLAPLGTDYLGRDILAGLIQGAFVTLEVGLGAALFTVLIGVVVGALAGFYGRRVDSVLMRVTEFFQVLPPLLLAMVLVLVFSPTNLTVIVAIGITNWTPVARVTRAEFLSLKEREFVTASRAMGASNTWLIWRVILPNAMPPIIVLSTLLVGTAILFQAALSFLGLTNQNIMSWGLMIGQSRQYIFDTWWAVTFPGIAILLTALSVSLIGDGLNDLLSVRESMP